jgi:cyclic pyranopterin phosphate synthase
MDVGNVNHWNRELVVPSADLLKTIHDRWPVQPVAKQPTGETARRYAFTDGAGEVGFISSITEPFCGDCSRARITADGLFYSCLFSAKGTVLRDKIREGMGADELTEVIRELWTKRADRYSELRSELPRRQPHVEMYRMGG